MYFREHCDGSYVTPDGREVSYLTVHVYLNGGKERKGKKDDNDSNRTSTKNDESALQDTDTATIQSPPTELKSNGKHVTHNQSLVGGATRFFSCKYTGKYMDINPERGACLVFQHRGLLHSGEEVEQGVKYTVRSDVMYEKVE